MCLLLLFYLVALAIFFHLSSTHIPLDKTNSWELPGDDPKGRPMKVCKTRPMVLYLTPTAVPCRHPEGLVHRTSKDVQI